MPNDQIKFLSDKECREADIELSIKPSRERFFEYHANLKEEYARLVKE